MPIPSPQERPDLYDGYDGSADRKEPLNIAIPWQIKELLAAKEADRLTGGTKHYKEKLDWLLNNGVVTAIAAAFSKRRRGK